jgi:hypothetical protein
MEKIKTRGWELWANEWGQRDAGTMNGGLELERAERPRGGAWVGGG